MKTSRMNHIINQIDDELILEAMDYQPRHSFVKKYLKPVTIIFACLILTGFFTKDLSTYQCNHQNIVTSNPPQSVCPCISLNNQTYTYTGQSTSNISNDYQLYLVYDAKTSASLEINNLELNNGDQIYISDLNPEIIYIYSNMKQAVQPEYHLFLKEK